MENNYSKLLTTTEPTQRETNFTLDKDNYEAIEFEDVKNEDEIFEITDINNLYLQGGNVKLAKVKGFWSDAGTHESMFKASEWARNKNHA